MEVDGQLLLQLSNLQPLVHSLLESSTERLEQYLCVHGRANLVPDRTASLANLSRLFESVWVIRTELYSDLLFKSYDILNEQIKVTSAPNPNKRFIKLKFEICFHDKTSKSKALDEHELLEYYESLTKKHGELGFRSFFSDFYKFDAIKEEWLIKLNRHGLVHSKRNGEFLFIHRTYAEYCCAQMVVYWLNQRTTPLQVSAYQRNTPATNIDAPGWCK